MARCLNNSVTGNTWFCVFSSFSRLTCPANWLWVYWFASIHRLCVDLKGAISRSRPIKDIVVLGRFGLLKSLFSCFNHEKTIFCRVRLQTKKKMISNKFYERTLIIIFFGVFCKHMITELEKFGPTFSGVLNPAFISILAIRNNRR